MADEKPKGKVAPRGKAIDRSDAELDEMTSAEAMMELAEEAADDWRENGPKGFSGLLDAKEAE